MQRLLAVLSGCALLGGCGGGSSPSPSPPAQHGLSLVVYLDANRNGRLDEAEAGRVPGVAVSVGGRSGVSTVTTGQVRLSGVPEGSHAVRLGPAMPPFFTPGAAVQVAVPAGGVVAVGSFLPVGDNESNVFMAFGDSITTGTGSTSGSGYRDLLAEDLHAHFASARVVDEGISGTKSAEGLARIADSLARVRPAYTLIHYGTNDWSNANCREMFHCDTPQNLRGMLQRVREADGLPVLATIVPANPERRHGPERNAWVSRLNTLVREVAQAEGALLVDLHAAFLAHDDLASLFRDAAHPNDAGYRLMADTFFTALTQPTSSF
jgi:lysophospholipase L1-like esterase